MITAFLFVCAFVQTYWLYRLVKKSDEHAARLTRLETRQHGKLEPKAKISKEEIHKRTKPSSWNNCDVTDKHGNHCPELPVHEADGMHLCERCFLNYQNTRKPKRQIFEKPVVPGAKEVQPLPIGGGKLKFDNENQIAEWV